MSQGNWYSYHFYYDNNYTIFNGYYSAGQHSLIIGNGMVSKIEMHGQNRVREFHKDSLVAQCFLRLTKISETCNIFEDKSCDTNAILKNLPDYSINYTECIPENWKKNYFVSANNDIKEKVHQDLIYMFRNPVDMMLSLQKNVRNRIMDMYQIFLSIFRLIFYLETYKKNNSLILINYEYGQPTQLVQYMKKRFENLNITYKFEDSFEILYNYYKQKDKLSFSISHRLDPDFNRLDQVEKLINYTYQLLPKEKNYRDDLLTIWKPFLNRYTKNGLDTEIL